MSKVFVPQPGQIDFTNVRWAPVINCVLKYQDKFLVVQRSQKLNFYPGFWNGISGFLDDQKSLEEKIFEELREELGIDKSEIISFQLAEIFDQDEPRYQKTWVVHPVLVTVSTDKVKLDWEASHFQWLDIEEIKKLPLMPGFAEVLEKISVLVS